MTPNPKFAKQDKSFWAHVRTISAQIGYTAKRTKKQPNASIHAPDIFSIAAAMRELSLSTDHLIQGNKATPLGLFLTEYFKERADVLNNQVRPLLMKKEEAKALYEKLAAQCKVEFIAPKNKQKDEKSGVAYLTGIVNIVIAQELDGAKCVECDYAPRQLTTFVHDGMPLRTLARWVDGAFPSAINPIAIWEIKEYYNTKTFGSRVADGVYESLLDGMELEELREHKGYDCQHLLIVDDHFTWWECGRSYLCRIFDMLHMGYVDEVLFGREVVTRLPIVVKEWLKRYKAEGRDTKAAPSNDIFAALEELSKKGS